MISGDDRLMEAKEISAKHLLIGGTFHFTEEEREVFRSEIPELLKQANDELLWNVWFMIRHELGLHDV